MRSSFNHCYQMIHLSASVETKEIYSHSYENEYYTTKVYKKFVKNNNKYIRNIFTYHFKMKRNALIQEAKLFGISKMGSKDMKEMADILISHNRKKMLALVVQKMDDFGVDRECIKEIAKLTGILFQ